MSFQGSLLNFGGGNNFGVFVGGTSWWWPGWCGVRRKVPLANPRRPRWGVRGPTSEEEPAAPTEGAARLQFHPAPLRPIRDRSPRSFRNLHNPAHRMAWHTKEVGLEYALSQEAAGHASLQWFSNGFPYALDWKTRWSSLLHAINSLLPIPTQPPPYIPRHLFSQQHPISPRLQLPVQDPTSHHGQHPHSAFTLPYP